MLKDKDQHPLCRKENRRCGELNLTHTGAPSSEANCEESDFILLCRPNILSFTVLSILTEHQRTIHNESSSQRVGMLMPGL